MKFPTFVIKDGERCKSLDSLVKRLARGDTLPPMPPKPPKPLDLRFIDSLNFEECEVVHDRVQARLSQMRTEDPMVYGVQRTFGGNRRYHTCVPSMGERQMLATDMGHSRLWLTSRRASAELAVECFSKSDSGHGLWEVFEILKVAAAKLPCYTYGPNYATNPEMVGVVCD